MEILSATLEDCRAIAQVHVASWRSAYRDMLSSEYLASLSVADREAMWRRMVERQPSHLLIARTEGEVIGFVAFGTSHDEDAPADRAEIYAIYVRAASWSTGAGRRLLLEALGRIAAEGYASVGLWVIDGNARAIRFYERAGFVCHAGSRKAVEIGGIALDELRYLRHIDPPAN